MNNGFYSTDTAGESENKSWQLRLGWSNGEKVYFCAGNSSDSTCLGNSSNHAGIPGYLSANNWYNVVVVYNGSNGNTSFYLNGVLNWSDSRANINLPTEALAIGKNPASVANTIFNGYIDDVLLFNRTLTSAEVSSLKNSQSNKYANNFTYLALGSYTFKGYAVDAAGNRNSTETRTVTLAVADATPPSISVTSPENTTYTTSNNITINFTSSDENAVSSRWFFNGTGNTTYTGITSQVLADGQYTFIFYSNDTSNNVYCPSANTCEVIPV